MELKFAEKVRGRRTLILALAGGALGLAASVMAYHYLEREENQFRDQLKAEHARNLVRVVVARGDLTAGTAVDDTNMAIRDVPRDYVYPETITPERFDRVRGQALIKPLGQGQPLLTAYLAEGGAAGLSDKLKEGRRAVTINVDEVSSLNGMIMPGDRIDLMLSGRDAGGNVVLPLLQAVRVLATGSRLSPIDAAAPGQDKFGLLYATLTLDVTPEDAARIVVARGAGTLTAVLRARGDEQPDEDAGVPLHAGQLFGAPAQHDTGSQPVTTAATVSYIMRGSMPGVANVIDLPIGTPVSALLPYAEPTRAAAPAEPVSIRNETTLEPAQQENK